MKKIISNRICSFKYAFQGFVLAIKSQVNLRIHICIAIFVFLLAFYLKVSSIDWCFLLLSVCMVISAEAFNTAIEYIGDAVTKEENEYIKKSKDCSAAAVLLTAIFASIVGIIIFVPYIAAIFV